MKCLSLSLSTLLSYKTKSATTDLKRTDSDLKTLLCSYGVQVIHDTA